MQIVQILLDRNADFQKPNKFGWTPCYIAAFQGHENVVRVLHEYGAEILTKDEVSNDNLSYIVFIIVVLYLFIGWKKSSSCCSFYYQLKSCSTLD